MPVGAPSLLRQLGKRPVTFLQAMIARLFGRVLVNANAAPAHLMHHRQKINVEAVGVAGVLLIEDRIQVLKQRQGRDRIGFGVGADQVRGQLARCEAT